MEIFKEESFEFSMCVLPPIQQLVTAVDPLSIFQNDQVLKNESDQLVNLQCFSPEKSNEQFQICFTPKQKEMLYNGFALTRYKNNKELVKLEEVVKIKEEEEVEQYLENRQSIEALKNEFSGDKAIKFTNQQLQKLNEEFDRENYPKKDGYEKIAKNIGVEESKVKRWFGNRRRKQKKQQNESYETDELSSSQSSSSSVEKTPKNIKFVKESNSTVENLENKPQNQQRNNYGRNWLVQVWRQEERALHQRLQQNLNKNWPSIQQFCLYNQLPKQELQNRFWNHDRSKIKKANAEV